MSEAFSSGVKWRSVRLPRRTVLQLAAFRHPLLQAAVEHGDVLVPHGAERPPGARRREHAERVVDDDAHAVADAHLLHARGELDGGREHVRQRRLLVREVVDVEEQGAGNVAREVFGLGVTIGGRQVPACVEHDQIRGIEMRGEPIGIDDPLLGAFEHVSLSCSLVNVYGQRLASRARSDIGKSREPRKDRGDLSRANPPLSGAKY